MTSQVEDYTKNVLKVVVAQICQIIGWNAINQSSLEVLVDTLDRFMQELTRQTYRVTELYQRTEPTLDDLALAFHYLNVNLSDIKEYIEYVGPCPESVPAIPKYPAAPPQILNVKRQQAIVSAEDANDSGGPSTNGLAPLLPPLPTEADRPKVEDSDDEEIFQGLFQYNREYKTEITGGANAIAADGSTVEVKREGGDTAGGDAKTEDIRELQRKVTQASRVPPKRKVTTVQLTSTGRIQGLREGRLPGADLPAMFVSEIEAAANSGLSDHPSHGSHASSFAPVDHKPSKSSKGHSHNKHNQDHSMGHNSFSHFSSNSASGHAVSSSAGPSTSGHTSRRDKLSQEPDRVKSNIFKKISQPHNKSSPTPPVPEVIDVDSSPNSHHTGGGGGGGVGPPQPALSSPGLKSTSRSTTPNAKREKKQKKNREKIRESHNSSASNPLPSHSQNPQFIDNSSILSNIPPLPAGTTLEAIPIKTERETPSQGNSMIPGMNSNPINPFDSAPPLLGLGPNFSLPPGPGLIPFGAASMVPNLLLPPATAALTASHRMSSLFPQLATNSPQLSPDSTSLVSPTTKKKEKEASTLSKKQKQLSGSVPGLMPSNLFLPDTTVRMVTVDSVDGPQPQQPREVKQEPLPMGGSGGGGDGEGTTLTSPNTIDLVTDGEETDAATVAAQAAAAKKAEKQKKKEQRKLEKLQNEMAAGGSGENKGQQEGIESGSETPPKKKDKASKMDRKLEKLLLKKMMKNKKYGGDADPSDEPIDLSMLDQEKQRKLEKKLKKLQKSNKAKLKAEQQEQAKEAVVRQGTPEPLALPKLTLKLNSPKIGTGEVLHSPKEFGDVREKAHGSKEYRPLTVDTSELMTPVKRLRAEAINSPGGSGMRQETTSSLHVEPELAKISPLVTRPMKQHQVELTSPSSSTGAGRGRPKGSSNKSHAAVAATPPVIPVKTVAEESSGAGNQVWICPACGSVDDGSPMIGCDGCDNWYHWLCVGIQVAPDASEDWFCRVCLMQRKEMIGGDGLSLDELAARKKEKKKRKKEKRAMRLEGGSP